MPAALATKTGAPDLSLLEIGVSTDSQVSGRLDRTLTLDHIGLIVPDLATGRDFLATALGITRWTPITNDPTLQVSVQFGAAPGQPLTYELIAPFGEQSPIFNALRAGKHILNHLAYLTPDLEASGKHLRGTGCYPTGDPLPALAYQGRLVQFWISPLRFVIELIEKPGHIHPFAEPESSEAGK
jgi:methylmalonyl-CoA/ethylmalonyl-CoA epimerase